jgi:hypothetical protein
MAKSQGMPVLRSALGGTRGARPARAAACSYNGINEREFSEIIPAMRWNFFAGPPIHIDGKGIAFPRPLNLYSRRQGIE